HTRLFATVSVGGRESLYWRARHQEILEYAVLDDGDRSGLDAFVVIAIETAQELPIEVTDRRVVIDIDKVGEDLLADFLGEGLAFEFGLLAMAFDAVAEDFVKRHAGSAIHQNRRPDVRFGQRRLQQSVELADDAIDCCGDVRIAG